MKIYGNSELTILRDKIESLLRKFSSELELINSQYTPTYEDLKRRRSNVIYYLGMTLFLFIIISFGVFLNVFDALYLNLIFYGINLLLTFGGLLVFWKVNKNYHSIKKEWDLEYNKILKYQDEINQLYSLAEIEVYKVISLTIHHEQLEKLKLNQTEYDLVFKTRLEEIKAEVKEKLGKSFSSEHVVSYYIEWGADITNQSKQEYDFLEVRRRKAEIRSKNIDIDSK